MFFNFYILGWNTYWYPKDLTHGNRKYLKNILAIIFRYTSAILKWFIIHLPYVISAEWGTNSTWWLFLKQIIELIKLYTKFQKDSY